MIFAALQRATGDTMRPLHNHSFEFEEARARGVRGAQGRRRRVSSSAAAAHTHLFSRPETVTDDPEGEAQGAVAAPTNDAQNGQPQPSSGTAAAARASRTPRGSAAATGSVSTPTPGAAAAAAAAAAASSRSPSTPSQGAVPQPRASPKSAASSNSSRSSVSSQARARAQAQAHARQQPQPGADGGRVPQSRPSGSAEAPARRSVTFAEPQPSSPGVADISERSTNSLMEEFRHQCVAILRQATGYDILPSSGKVVVFDHRLPIRHAFMGLVEHDIKCGPVWNRLVRDFIGMLTVTDFIDILIHFHSMQKKSSAQQQQQNSSSAEQPAKTESAATSNARASASGGSSPTNAPPPSGGSQAQPTTASATATASSTRVQTLRTAEPGGGGGSGSGNASARHTPTSRSSRSSKPSHVLTGSSALFSGIEDLTVMQWTEIKMKSKGKNLTSLVHILPDQSLYEGIQILNHFNIHRLPVMQKYPENTVLCIINHQRLLRFLMGKLLREWPESHDVLVRLTVGDLADRQVGTFDNLVTATMATPVVKILSMLNSHSIPCIPLLDENGSYVDAYTRSDVRFLALDGHYHNLDMTIEEAIGGHHMNAMARVPTCTRQAPLYTVFNRLLHHRKHVCVCIDDERRIVAIITLGDVFSFFLPERMSQAPHSGRPTVPEALSHFDEPQTPKAAGATSQAAAAASSKRPGPPHRRGSSLLEAIAEGNVASDEAAASADDGVQNLARPNGAV